MTTFETDQRIFLFLSNYANLTTFLIYSRQNQNYPFHFDYACFVGPNILETVV